MPEWKVSDFSRVLGGVSLHEGIRLGDYASEVPSNRVIVEVGANTGVSTGFLAMGAKKGHGAHVYTVDLWDCDSGTRPDRHTVSEAHQLFRAQMAYLVATGHIGADSVCELQGESSAVAAQWRGLPIGLLHLDGDHSYEGCRADLEAWTPYVAKGGVVIVHDWAIKNVRRAVKEWMSADWKRIGIYRWAEYPKSRGQWIARRR